MCARNPGTSLDLEWVSKSRVNTQAVLKRAQQIQSFRLPKKQWQAAWLLRAVTCIDLTTLSGDDTPSNVQRLCLKALQPIRSDLLQDMDMHHAGITTAAVCVYPSRVSDAVKTLKAANSSLPVASVATGFPAGQTPLQTRLEEVRLAVADGAAEIDIVINRTLALTGQWQALYEELVQFRTACGNAHMKSILASLVSMMAGSDFIKTSTGKEAVNATIPVAVVMSRAIRDYYIRTGYKIGFKPAGGIRTESLVWLVLVKEELGSEWLSPELFRIGASSLLADIETDVYHTAISSVAWFYHTLVRISFHTEGLDLHN
uniref:Deoxyribose-phosphate aldolase n=1 Tax=Neogobius melanostomus TaxID=47308 RepID=A0A8C6WXR0_9GOBI